MGGEGDAYIRKYSPSGSEVWTRQFGSVSFESLTALVTDEKGDVYAAGVGGVTTDTLVGQEVFLRKMSALGSELWTRHFGTRGADEPGQLLLEASGSIILAGTMRGTASPTASGFLFRYDASGMRTGALTIDGGAGEEIVGVALSSSRLYVAGSIYGQYAGQMSSGNNDGLVMRVAF